MLLALEVQGGLESRHDAGAVAGKDFFRNEISQFGKSVPQGVDGRVNQTQIVERPAFDGGFDKLRTASSDGSERLDQRLENARGSPRAGTVRRKSFQIPIA